MAGKLEGKVAVITGAASGLGEATARLMAAEGARVVLGDIQDDRGQALAAELGPDARYVHCDVTDEAQVAGLVVEGDEDAARGPARHLAEEVFLAREVVVERLPRHPRERGDLVDARLVSRFPERLGGGADQPLAAGVRIGGGGWRS